MKCPQCGKDMRNILDDGDGMANTVSEFDCPCGMKIERQTRDWISLFKIDNPILHSQIDILCRFAKDVELSDFERIWGPKTGPSLWSKFQDAIAEDGFGANFFMFWGYLDAKNQSRLLREINYPRRKRDGA